MVHEYDGKYFLGDTSVDYAAHKAWRRENVNIYGENTDIGAGAWEDCSCMNADNTYLTYTAAKDGFFVSSTAAGDNYWTSGVGVHVVRIIYLDSNWDEKTCDIRLRGASGVAVPSSMMRVSQMRSIKASGMGNKEAWSETKSAGDITLYSGATTYLKIETGHSTDHCGSYYVPSGKNLIITDTWCGPTNGSESDLEFRFDYQIENEYNGTKYYTYRHHPLGTSTPDYIYMNHPATAEMPYKIDQRSHLRVRVRSNEGMASGQAVLRGYIIDKYS